MFIHGNRDSIYRNEVINLKITKLNDDTQIQQKVQDIEFESNWS